MKTKCNKCDERGYISKHENGSYSGRSCECGWAVEQSMKKFEGVDIWDLLAYGQMRREEKGRLAEDIDPVAVNELTERN